MRHPEALEDAADHVRVGHREGQEKVLGTNVRMAEPASFADRILHDPTRTLSETLEHLSPPTNQAAMGVLLVDGLPADAECPGNLLPRPALCPGIAHVERLQLLQQSPQ
jgi:hypothetical protein